MTTNEKPLLLSALIATPTGDIIEALKAYITQHPTPSDTRDEIVVELDEMDLEGEDEEDDDAETERDDEA